jgi:hypothetical protein
MGKREGPEWIHVYVLVPHPTNPENECILLPAMDEGFGFTTLNPILYECWGLAARYLHRCNPIGIHSIYSYSPRNSSSSFTVAPTAISPHPLPVLYVLYRQNPLPKPGFSSLGSVEPSTLILRRARRPHEWELKREGKAGALRRRGRLRRTLGFNFVFGKLRR